MSHEHPAVDAVFRYAAPGSPEDRFSEAVPLGEDQPVPTDPVAFPQLPGSLDALIGPAIGELEQSSEAFVLRVQAPSWTADAASDDHGPLPVLVFIPGGGFLSGAAATRWFTTPSLTEGGPAVVVTVNYRVGALGHLGATAVEDLEPGEAARDSQRPVRDLLLALTWVKQHVAQFGGDPDNITLAGDSAGAWYTYALSSHPEAAGLFRRAAMISLPYEPPIDNEGLIERRRAMQEALAESGGLSSAPMSEVLAAQREVSRAYAGKGMAFMPGAGGWLPADLHDFSVAAGRLHVDQLALLATSEEAAAFLYPAPDEAFPPPAVAGFLGAKFEDPHATAAWIDSKRPDATSKQRMIEALTLFQFSLAGLELARAATAAGKTVHLAGFHVQSGLPGAFSPHCMPLPFLFGNREYWSDAPLLTGVTEKEFEATSAGVRAWLLGFVRDGQPVRDDGQALAPFDVQQPRRWEFRGQTRPTHEQPSETELHAQR